MANNIEVFDERYVGSFVIVMLRDPKTSKTRSAVLKKNKVNQYNRNKQEDINKLWDLAEKYKGKEIKESHSKLRQIIREEIKNVLKERFNWEYFYLNKKGELIDEDGNLVNKRFPKFKSIEDAEKFLEKEDIRANVVGYKK